MRQTRPPEKMTVAASASAIEAAMSGDRTTHYLLPFHSENMGEKLQRWKKRLCGWHVGRRMPPGITGTSWLIKDQLVYIGIRYD